MELFVEWCGFIGAWLLVAGPVYQAALELKEEQIESEHIDATRQKLPPQKKTSPWWWLVPPVKIFLERSRNKAYRKAFFSALPDEDVEAMVSFINKASAWLYVATGGLLLAINETYTLLHALHASLIIFWITVVGLAVLSVINTAYRIARGERVITTSNRDS